MWDPVQYSRFGDARSRAFFDLVARIELQSASRVIDLGCGTGELTAVLAKRWPEAFVLGVDNSTEMLARARRHEIPGRLEFVLADIAELAADRTAADRPATDRQAAGPPAADLEANRPFDVVVANASLQWVPGHLEVLGVLAERLADDGVLAFQVPDNFEAPSHRAVRELCTSPRWRLRVGEAGTQAAVHEPDTYLVALASRGLHVDAWETTYLHLLEGHDAVLEWLKGTTLRPVLDRLAPDEQEPFLTELGESLAQSYPEQEFGTVLPFRRIFVVARRSPTRSHATSDAVNDGSRS